MESTQGATTPLKSSSNRRTERGIIVRPRQQFRYAFLLVGSGILVQSFVMGGVVWFLKSAILNVVTEQHGDPALAAAITNTISYSFALLMLVAVASALFAVLIGVRLSHRIYGPLVPISRHIEHLKAGRYAVRMNLRKTDDLVEIKNALNSLAETLHSKYGPET